MSITKPSFEIEGVRSRKIPPRASWTCAIPSAASSAAPKFHLPQTIAHRGYKAAWPENSLAGFEAAVQVGAHALETDLRLSADKVIVLSHDPSLKRCFGVDRLVADCEWEALSQLRTVRQPAQGMPRLSDLLEWLVASRERDAVWLMLDIKVEDDADELMMALKRTLEQVPSHIPWHQRIVLGCWNATYIQSAISILPSFPPCLISMSLSYSQHFSPIPNLSFSLSQFSLLGPQGTRFLRDAKRLGRQTFTWTVNKERWMECFVRKNIPPSSAGPSAPLIDGVITDDPKLFLHVCARIQAEVDGTPIPAMAYDKRQSYKNNANRGGLLGFFAQGMSSLYQLLLGSFARSVAYLIMQYKGHFDYFSEADFVAQFPRMDGDTDEDRLRDGCNVL